MDTAQLYTIQHAADAVGKHRQSLHRAINRGTLPFETIDGIRFVRLSDARKWAAKSGNFRGRWPKST